MEYFEDEKPTSGCVCSDPECPCNETSIPVGTGYLYIPKSCCEFRRDCRTRRELHDKAERIARRSNQYMIFGHGVASPILVCEEGAKKRRLDLDVAAKDAKHWWTTGHVPLRPTPRAGDPQVPRADVASHRPAAATSSSSWLVLIAIVVAIGVAVYLANGH
ncbi:MAG: hypothetical protein E6J90_49405 [Deltaproteobacteria bacterium]|nr:MAG: hypothetical protein E6J91_43605 [Deltaproteobacteria bacterium]TMQ05304.1 MAG: hypothetical protein E6J90_49405 [Deltaproteobacteria bacterium]